MESSESIASSLDEVRNMKLLTTNLLNIARRDDGLKPEIEEIEPSFLIRPSRILRSLQKKMANSSRGQSGGQSHLF